MDADQRIINGNESQYTTQNEPVTVDIVEELDVIKISDTEYRSKVPLKKPGPRVRGVYGGAFASQAILVAVRSSPPNFKPNAIHTFFAKKGLPDVLVTWKVQNISTGKTFANRSIQAIQNGEVRFTANVSLTTKNESSGDSITEKSLSFQGQRTSELENYTDVDQLKGYDVPDVHLSIRDFDEYESKDIYSYIIKYGINHKEKVLPIPPEFKYVAFTWITDWMSLNYAFVSRGQKVQINFNVSLDHSIYFHDDDFDATQWTGICLKTPIYLHNRCLIICELYNESGKHVASVVQERLFVTKPVEPKANL
ncbi:uncharacterized protein KGF55_001747 [Candida pseudojiufengensis]|uniref:uncharacterized protein n=1 Tax=Candida pseudojiufengensis TaxID=497109 RepID=UPI0022243418|nr:uncharacterized protein KGF55_001747 [Candida pseudojiufengensis]KAI5964678.1 hypothetical protein KGF55_001747 [Candida pseudojiufengensis]